MTFGKRSRDLKLFTSQTINNIILRRIRFFFTTLQIKSFSGWVFGAELVSIWPFEKVIKEETNVLLQVGQYRLWIVAVAGFGYR